MKFKKSCPLCGNEQIYSSIYKLNRALDSNSKCKQCAGWAWRGKKHSEETKQKISLLRKGIKNPTHAGRMKIIMKGRFTGSKNPMFGKDGPNKNKFGKLNPFYGKTHSEKTKELMREKRILDLKSKYPINWNSRNYNKKACQIFDEINKELNWNGQHAELIGERQICGFFVDYYEPDLNIVIEYDEKKHNEKMIRDKDIYKEQTIINSLKCEFFRIKEGQDWRNILAKYLLCTKNFGELSNESH